MTAVERFAKGRLACSSLQHPLRGLDVHALNHCIFEPLGAAVERFDQAPRPLDLGLARRECAMAGVDLVGMDQALAVKAEAASILCFGNETFGIVESVEYAVEHGHSNGSRGKHD